MPDKPNPHAGMVKCAVKSAFGPHKTGASILMHPMDALEHHNLGLVEADKKFLDDLKVLDDAKRKQREAEEAKADRQTEE